VRDQFLRSIAESGYVPANHVAAEHSQHLWSGAINGGHACQQSYARVERHDGPRRRGEFCSSHGNDSIEIWDDDDAEDAEETKLVLWRQGEDYPRHEQKRGNLSRRSPASDAVLNLIVEQFLASNGRALIPPKRAGDFAPLWVL
jgi:hypothetical protein